ncbi:EamA family transporter [Candidatus Woesearchaeota archaeon]|nr:EamA family transporter [Candidatus Woesearchaeota archaeon]
MMWAFLSIISGFGDAIIFAIMKKLKDLHSSIIVWVQYAFALPILSIFLYLNYPNKINANVYWVAILSAILLVYTTYLLFKAAIISDLSISMPMLSLTPLFLILTSYFMLDELPTMHGFFGIFLIVVGAYTIHLKDYKKGFIEPFKSLIRNKGSFYVVIVAFLWSISANLSKMGILYSNPIFFVFLVYLFISIIMVPLISFNLKEKMKEIKSNFNMLVFLGFSSAFMVAASAYAMLVAIVPYVISLKRGSVIFSIFFGYFFFNEKDIKNALIGTIIMIIGGVFITLF